MLELPSWCRADTCCSKRRPCTPAAAPRLLRPRTYAHPSVSCRPESSACNGPAHEAHLQALLMRGLALLHCGRVGRAASLGDGASPSGSSAEREPCDGLEATLRQAQAHLDALEVRARSVPPCRPEGRQSSLRKAAFHMIAVLPDGMCAPCSALDGPCMVACAACAATCSRERALAGPRPRAAVAVPEQPVGAASLLEGGALPCAPLQQGGQHRRHRCRLRVARTGRTVRSRCVPPFCHL